MGEGAVIGAHDVEIDDDAGTILSSIAEELANTVGHGALPLTRSCDPWRRSLARAAPMCRVGGENAPPFAVRTVFAAWPEEVEPWQRCVRRACGERDRSIDAFAWYGKPDRTPGKK
ncbi:hypothetical protein GCM10017653_12620 [Ancylobacter defluvii]|uniref:Uncharacterized protein n=1 Tax=Ancylobacter defluvii TaxID=1282440 RepID=A0A9W6JVA0_9HYPH|nr:hypothetical protein GCM10017653_12620 [Ancylobacter defluvii]